MFESQAQTLKEAMEKGLGCWVPCLIPPRAGTPFAFPPLSLNEIYIIIDVPGEELPVTAIESRFRVIVGGESEEGDLSGKFREGLVNVTGHSPYEVKEGTLLCEVRDYTDTRRFDYPEEDMVFGNFEDPKWGVSKRVEDKVEHIHLPPNAAFDITRGRWVYAE